MPTDFGHKIFKSVLITTVKGKRVIFRICLIFFILAVNVNVFAAKPLTKLTEIKIPDTEFFGSLSLVLDAQSPWSCNLNNGYVIHVIPWKTKGIADYWEPSTQYCLNKISDNGKEETLCKELIEGKDDVTAIKICFNGEKLIFYGLGGKLLFQNFWDKSFSLLPNTTIDIYGDNKSKLLKLDNRFEKYNVRKTFDLDRFVPNKLREGMLDDHTGYWHYLDKITPNNQHVVLGGRYRVAIVPNPDRLEQLLIVYIEGSTDDSKFWEKGDIKGILVPTTFENHYNLIWFDSRRRPAGLDECSATFDGVNLLTLNFPLLESQIRFERELE